MQRAQNSSWHIVSAVCYVVVVDVVTFTAIIRICTLCFLFGVGTVLIALRIYNSFELYNACYHFYFA